MGGEAHVGAQRADHDRGTRRHPAISPICACSTARPISNPRPKAAAFPISPCPGGTRSRPGIFRARIFWICRASSPIPDTALRFMMPGCRAARDRVRPPRRIRNDSRVVLYSIGTADVGDAVLVDAADRSASRTLSVLDGGLDKWKARRPRDRDRARRRDISRRRSRRNRKGGYFVDKHEMLAATADRNTVVVNALGPQFHKGLEPSRYGRPGRIPGSCNVSAATLLDPADQGVRPARGRRSEIHRRRASPKTSAWSPIAAAASRRPSTCSCCTGSVTTTSRSTTARWANGPRMRRCRSRRVRL